MEELIQALHRLFPYDWSQKNKREVIIEVTQDEYNNHNPITKYFENQRDNITLIQNTENFDLHQKPEFTSLKTPLGITITLKIKE